VIRLDEKQEMPLSGQTPFVSDPKMTFCAEGKSPNAHNFSHGVTHKLRTGLGMIDSEMCNLCCLWLPMGMRAKFPAFCWIPTRFLISNTAESRLLTCILAL
jgi:hypothetical protein